jgi:hypothetical protein
MYVDVDYLSFFMAHFIVLVGWVLVDLGPCGGVGMDDLGV